ncbi:MAG TPA: hypothetical protein VHO69_19905, partial [Phototrophicaceae bacterium]|nr:hypothetical protein [Phototrophicaceae bacterium]
MSVIPEHFRLDLQPNANPEAIVRVGNARFTLLAERLLRLEYNPAGEFENRASQAMWFRQQSVPAFTVHTTPTSAIIENAYLRLEYQDDGSGFTPENLSIQVKATNTVWHPGDVDETNLRGTMRTLDGINGYTPLSLGLMSRAGWSVLDDSRS